jgi:hypothetical protein
LILQHKQVAPVAAVVLLFQIAAGRRCIIVSYYVRCIPSNVE